MDLSRIHVERKGNTTRIDVGPPRHPSVALFAVAWLAFGGIFAVVARKAAVASLPISGRVFFAFWFVGVTSIFTLGVVGVLAHFFAHEEFVLTDETLTIVWRLFFVRISRSLSSAGISDICLGERRGRRGRTSRHIRISCEGKVISSTVSLTLVEGMHLLGGPLGACARSRATDDAPGN